MKFLSLLFVLLSSLAAAVENSVVPTLEFLENSSHLQAKKYTKNQFDEIAAALENRDEKLRLITFNMLRSDYDQWHKEENCWKKRLPRVVETIQEMNPDLIGAQELSLEQANELQDQLKEYNFFGEPRSDGEINGIFYRKDRLELKRGRVIPIGKNNLMIAEFKDLKTERQFTHLNIHAAFSRIEDREKEARLIAKQAAILAPKMAVLVTGDLNTFPNRADLLALPFYDGGYIHRILTSRNILRDAQEVSLLGHIGPISTFTNKAPSIAGFEGIGTPGVILDHIYVSDSITVLIHATEPATVDGHFPSDHMPVLIDFLIP